MKNISKLYMGLLMGLVVSSAAFAAIGGRPKAYKCHGEKASNAIAAP